MSLARTLARPFWSCKSCKAIFMRAFTTKYNTEFPRLRPGRRIHDDIDTAHPVKTREHAPAIDSAVGFLPTFEQDAFDNTGNQEWLQKREKRRDAEEKRRTPNKAKVKGLLRSDGISNLSNRRTESGLRIPGKLLDAGEENKPFSKWDFNDTPLLDNKPLSTDHPSLPMSNLPWYLQAQHTQAVQLSQETEENTLDERQKLPDLPAYAPPTLEPILNYLFINIGLDDLSILDLRALDPAPALGNNLIMILGTARSEKHLNVAAERLCAHLRREYNQYPYADGLVGRHESKIKQRRRKKKMTALADAGGLMPGEEFDDGMKTGWICVHAGYYDPHAHAPKKSVRRFEGLIGFGEENNKITLVVQMFVNGKREDVGLEALWKSILERNLRKQAYQQDQADSGDAGGDDTTDDQMRLAESPN